jgi:hypothetical protein
VRDSMWGVHWIPTHRGEFNGRQDREWIADLEPGMVKIVAIDTAVPYTEDVPADAMIVVRNHPMSELNGARALASAGIERGPNSSLEERYESYFRWYATVSKAHISTAPWTSTASSNVPRQVLSARSSEASSPESIGAAHATTCQKMAQYCEGKGVSRGRLVFEGLNEPQLWGNEPPDLTARYYRAFLTGLHGYGLHGVVGNFGVGWPGNGGVADAPPAWDFFKPVIDIMQPGDYLGLHEYWSIDGPKTNWRWWGGRFLQCPYDVPILITECGVDTGVVGVWNGGWRDIPGRTTDEIAAAYLEMLWWYMEQCASDGRVKCVFPFTHDIGGKEWEKFDIRDGVFLPAAINRLGLAGGSYPKSGSAPVPPTPPDPPSPPPVPSPTAEYMILPVEAGQEPNQGVSYVYGWCAEIDLDGSWVKWMGDMTKVVHLRAAGSGTDAIEPMPIGPHPGYEDWKPGYYNLSPLQNGKWEIAVEDRFRKIWSPWQQFSLDHAQAHIDFAWKRVVNSYSSLNDALKVEARVRDLLAVNPAAALCREGWKRGIWPTSNEFDISYNGTVYRAQRFRDPGSDRVYVLYCKVGDWGNVQELSWQ